MEALSLCLICSHILTCAQNLDLATAWISLNMGCCWDCRGVTAWMTAVNSWDGLLPAEITNVDSRNDFSAFGQSVFAGEFLCLNHKAHKNAVFAHCERQISLYEISLQWHQPPVCNISLHLYQFALWQLFKESTCLSLFLRRDSLHLSTFATATPESRQLH